MTSMLSGCVNAVYDIFYVNKIYSSWEIYCCVRRDELSLETEDDNARTRGKINKTVFKRTQL